MLAPTNTVLPPPIHCSQFFSLGGDHSRYFEGERGTGGTKGNCFVFHEEVAAGQQAESSQTENARRADSECATLNPTFSEEVPSSCPSSPPQAFSADETIRLLLARRSPPPSCQSRDNTSNPPCRYVHPAATYTESSNQTTASADCSARRSMFNLNSLSRSGKRQRTAKNLLGQILLNDFSQVSNESASQAIVEIIENSAAWKEIFYYATTEPAAIRIPY